MAEGDAPVYDLAAIQTRVAAGDYHFEEYAVEGYLNLGFSEAQVLTCIAGLTIEAHFLRSEVSTHEHFIGEKFDVYIFHPHLALEIEPRCLAEAGPLGWACESLLCARVEGAQEAAAMNCECGGEYREVTEPRSFRIHGREVTVNATFMRCELCKHAVWAPGQVGALRREAWNAIRDREGLLYPEEILDLRTSLGLSQGAFEQLLGVGKKTVTRWENGVIFPSAAANNLMKLLRLDRRNVNALATWSSAAGTAPVARR